MLLDSCVSAILFNKKRSRRSCIYGGGRMITVEKLIKQKGTEVWSVSPEDSVYNAIKLMSEKGIGALAVVQKDTLAGIISERDYAGKVILQGRSSKETKVKDIMTTHVFHTVPEQHIDECLVIMNERRIRHLPVLQDGNLIGLLSIGDVVKEIIKDQKYTIKQLENHISWEENY